MVFILSDIANMNHEKVCENKDFRNVLMPSGDT